jgi:outer membrane protein assembly factor BamB
MATVGRSVKWAVAVAVLMFGVSAPAARGATARAYVERSLQTRTGRIPVIVSASTSQVAALAVNSVGGIVTSDLWIAKSVGAILNPAQMAKLAADPRVTAIVDNKTVRGAEWNGWVSDLRVVKGKFLTSSQAWAPPTHLSGGGFATVTYSGELLVVNADGSEKVRKALPRATTDSAFYMPVALSADESTYYVADALGVFFAVGSDGSLRWQNSVNLNLNYYVSKPVVAADGTIVVVTYTGNVFAFDPATGAVRWQQALTARNTSYIVEPVIGPDGTVYVSSAAGDISAITSAGVRWSTSLGGGKGNDYGIPPVLGGNTLYAAAGTKVVAFDTATGAQRFAFTAPAAILGQPIVRPDGTLYVASAAGLQSFTPIGQSRWVALPPAGQVFAAPARISADGTRIYTTTRPAKGKKTDTIVSYDTATGANVLKKVTSGSLAAELVPDADGGLFVAMDDNSVYRYEADGTETHRLKVHAPVNHMSQASATGNILVRLTTTPQELHFIGRLPNAWSGRKDVDTGERPGSWRFMNNYAVDVGADKLHQKLLPSGAKLQGTGVTVAVVDSGVYWDASTKALLGVHLQRLFLGQADFVETQCGAAVTSGCLQNTDHAFHNYNTSRDAYGHGSHVAGTITNKLIDDAISDQTNSVVNYLGVAPDANTLSVRVLGADGTGNYETVIRGIQYVVANKARFNVRVLNLSLSAYATVPYFVDPLNRATEVAWLNGIAVLAAAGNTGPFASSVTVPGNDPYVITVGAVSSNRTAGYWRDDIVPLWSATGPTYDGFAKPDVVAPGSQIVSYMYNGGLGDANTATLVRQHPDYSTNIQLFRMNGTSMATAVASGVAALMIQANPALTPDQVKYRLMNTAQWSSTQQGEPVYNTFQQGMGRVWAPDAVLNNVDPAGAANLEMNLTADLAHGYETVEDLAFHYQGPVQRLLSDDGTAYLYYGTDTSGTAWGFGVTDLNGNWLDANAVARMSWAGARMSWAGGLSWAGDAEAYAVARMSWAGARMSWAGARMSWAGARLSWAGARMSWAGGNTWAGGAAWGVARMSWAGNAESYAVARMSWAGSLGARSSSASNSRWIDDLWIRPFVSNLPPPVATAP